MPTVGDLWSYYFENHVRRRSTSAGQETAVFAWKNLRPAFALVTVQQVNQQSVDDYSEARAAGLIGRPAKPITIRRELATLLAALRYCAAEELIAHGELRRIRLPVIGPSRRRALSLNECQILLDTAAGGRLTDNRLTKCERFIWLALQTGARKTAILNLRWDRVDFQTGFIDYREPDRPPTKKRRAVVAISAELRLVLERAYQERISEYVLDNNADTVWAQIQVVALRAFGGPRTRGGACPKGTGIGPHTFRHTAATLMARAGVPLFHVAGVLANTLQMTESVYAHQAPADPNIAVNHITRGQLKPPR